MADWATLSQVGTAAGTLVLAVATFQSVRSAARSTQLAERNLLASQRPLLIPSRDDDPVELIRFREGIVLEVKGHCGTAEIHDDQLLLAMSLRNGGSGMAVIHSWEAVMDPNRRRDRPDDLTQFRRLTRDLYIPAGYTGFWQGAIRDVTDQDYLGIRVAIEQGERVFVDLLYSDQEGGQRAIARFGVPTTPEDNRGRLEAIKYWIIDGPDPREIV